MSNRTRKFCNEKRLRRAKGLNLAHGRDPSISGKQASFNFQHIFSCVDKLRRKSKQLKLQARSLSFCTIYTFTGWGYRKANVTAVSAMFIVKYLSNGTPLSVAVHCVSIENVIWPSEKTSHAGGWQKAFNRFRIWWKVFSGKMAKCIRTFPFSKISEQAVNV